MNKKLQDFLNERLDKISELSELLTLNSERLNKDIHKREIKKLISQIKEQIYYQTYIKII